jgi:hypothetical protein
MMTYTDSRGWTWRKEDDRPTWVLETARTEAGEAPGYGHGIHAWVAKGWMDDRRSWFVGYGGSPSTKVKFRTHTEAIESVEMMARITAGLRYRHDKAADELVRVDAAVRATGARVPTGCSRCEGRFVGSSVYACEECGAEVDLMSEGAMPLLKFSYRVDVDGEGFTLTPIKDDGFGRVTHDHARATRFESFDKLAAALADSLQSDQYEEVSACWR